MGYYRLSWHWYIYKQNPGTGDGSLAAGSPFGKVRDPYTFDRQPRLITLDAIERVEVYMRT